ncbi:MAG: hypothetical protein M3Q09_01960 [Gemmatimonadota bacterium]|nr:hypothetical protein [Gemmatimonadota bacterium]
MTQPACTSRHLYSSLLLGFLLLASCDKGKDNGAAAGASSAAPSAPAQSADEQLAELGEYSLSMDKFDKYLAAQRNIMLKAKDMSPADKQAMEARNEGRNNANASLDDMVRNVESEPMMNAAVRDAGLSAREFALVAMSLMQTGMAAGVAKMRPKDNQDSLIRAMKANPANVKFLLENEAAITRKQKDLKAEMKRLGADEG